MPSKDSQRYASDNQRKRRIIRIILDIIVCAVLIVVVCFSRTIVEMIIVGKTTLEPGSSGFETWVNPPITTTRNYHLFTISNPIEIVTEPSTAKVYINETPAYAYNVETKKINIQWLNNNKEISYGVERLFNRDPIQFDPSLVNETGIFLDMLRAIYRVQFEPRPAQPFYDLGGINTFYRRNTLEQLEGFTSELFTTLRDRMKGPNTNQSGLVYRQNGSRLYSVSIESDSMKKGQVRTFSSDLISYNITSPSDYNFTIYDGLTFPPNLYDKPSLHIFNSDFCRPILIQFNGEKTMFGGIKMHEYKVKLIDYDNCTDFNDTNTCNEVDKLDVSACISDSIPPDTIFLSKAHFYGSSEETIEEMKIEGFTPTSEKHDSFIYFEPLTGTPFKASYRMQLNIEATIDPVNQLDTGELVKTKRKGVKRFIPIFWIDQKVDLSEEFINKLRTALNLKFYAPHIATLIAILLSVTFIGIMELIGRRADRNDRHKNASYIRTEALVQD